MHLVWLKDLRSISDFVSWFSDSEYSSILQIADEGLQIWTQEMRVCGFILQNHKDLSLYFYISHKSSIPSFYSFLEKYIKGYHGIYSRKSKAAKSFLKMPDFSYQSNWHKAPSWRKLIILNFRHLSLVLFVSPAFKCQFHNLAY